MVIMKFPLVAKKRVERLRRMDIDLSIKITSAKTGKGSITENGDL